MKIKIIEPYDLNPRYDIRSLTSSPGPIVIASLLNQSGHDAEVISEYVTRLTFDELQDADLVGISITTYNACRGFEIARQIKQPVVFGGFHASLMPEECLQYGEYVIRGDGHPIVELADFLSGKGATPISDIPNLVYRQNGSIRYNRTEARAINVIPDFNLVKDYFKFNLNRLLRIPLLVNASRGCHFDCAFCSIKVVFPDFVKKKIETVVKDTKNQLKHQPYFSCFLTRVIWITDDNFSSDKKWAKDLLKKLAGIETKYRLVIQARVDIARDDELLDLMQKAGIGIVYLGIESLDQQSLDNLDKNISAQDIGTAIKKIQNHGLDVHGLFLFGDDEFKRGDGARVARFVKQHRLSGALIQPLTPYPGTRLYRKLKAEGRILSENWRDYNGKVVIKPKNLTAAELMEEIYSCYRKVYSPIRVIKFFLSGQQGFKLQILGEAIFRRLEWVKSKRYIKDHLLG